MRDASASGAWAVGLMSGTSMDGIDAALIETDGRTVARFGPSLTVPYAPAQRAALRAVLGGRGDVATVERDLTLAHADAVGRLLDDAGLSPAAVRVIGFHGHTILHAPEERRTRQIGDGALLAERTGIDVVFDLRSADVAAGGQGAPLVPVFHAALATRLETPLAVLNVGGVANVTWIGAPDSVGTAALLAFDTGPGNALIDDWVSEHTGESCDRDGRLAASGQVDATRLDALLRHPYLDEPPPKSLDRDAFAACRPDGLRAADGAALLTAFTAATVARAAGHLPAPPRRWIVCGGGRHNPVLMDALRQRLTAPVQAAEAVGWDGDQIEAQAFAFLAVRHLAGLPLTFPGTTGAPSPLRGGRLAPRGATAAPPE